MLPEKIRQLNVSIGDAENAGQLIRASTYEFRYVQPQAEQATVALLSHARHHEKNDRRYACARRPEDENGRGLGVGVWVCEVGVGT